MYALGRIIGLTLAALGAAFVLTMLLAGHADAAGAETGAGRPPAASITDVASEAKGATSAIDGDAADDCVDFATAGAVGRCRRGGARRRPGERPSPPRPPDGHRGHLCRRPPSAPAMTADRLPPLPSASVSRPHPSGPSERRAARRMRGPRSRNWQCSRRHCSACCGSRNDCSPASCRGGARSSLSPSNVPDSGGANPGLSRCPDFGCAQDSSFEIQERKQPSGRTRHAGSEESWSTTG